MKDGPVWSDVVARVTADAVSEEILDSELARDITGSPEHTPLEGGPRDIQKILMFEASKARSPSLIPQTLFGEGECVDTESAVTRIPVTTEPKRLVNGPYWNLNCFNPCSLAVATECFRLLRNYSVSSMRCSERQDWWKIFENHTERRICSDPV